MDKATSERTTGESIFLGMCSSQALGMQCATRLRPPMIEIQSVLRMVLPTDSRAWLRALGLCLAGILLSGPGYSLESSLTLQQLNHKSWTAANGAPSDVVAFAQTPDGTLWIGSEMGLFRFDGLSFVRYAGPPTQ